MIKKEITYCKYELKFPYFVTDDGRVWSKTSSRFLSPQLDKNGYEKIRLVSTDGKRHRYSIHRLVLQNFQPIQNMANYQVNHKDGNKRNNTLDNLEWVTCEENIQHAVENGLRAKINGAAVLTEEQVIEIYKRSHNGERNIDLGDEFKVHPDTIGKIKNRKSWKNVLDHLD